MSIDGFKKKNENFGLVDTLQHRCQEYWSAIQEELFGVSKPKETDPESYFRLPITYLDPSQIHNLSPVVSSDLELMTSENISMYECYFQPKHSFAKRVLPLWNKQYTSNVTYLEDSQAILKQMGYYKTHMEDQTYVVNCDEIMGIWKEIKTNSNFLEKYGYVEWYSLRYVNQSDSFLQILSMANLCSPLLSLSIPFFIFLFPFLILKLQGVPLTFETYLDVLKTVARHHFIGKTLASLSELSLDRILYILFSFGLYAVQVYQNITSCARFYKNIKYINLSLLHIKGYVNYSIQSMETYLQIAMHCESYHEFSKEVELQCSRLRRLRGELSRVSDFSSTLGKLGEIGYMLRCFYELHTNSEYEAAIGFSMGFEGYINNLSGVMENISVGALQYARVLHPSKKGSPPPTVFQGQYYPSLKDETPVKNDLSLDKNIIISAPNKAGKTTLLKTTAINIILTQQLGCGFYTDCSLVPYTHIHSYLNIPDTSGRDSLFQAESRRCKDILDIIQKESENPASKSRHFCIFDELFSGTNPEEATKAGHAFLHYLSNYNNVNFMLTTHYLSICKKFRASEKIKNYKMGVRVLEDGSFLYTYKMKPGISTIQGAIRVLKDMNYPAEILDMLSQ
jgi:hypothetical protein